MLKPFQFFIFFISFLFAGSIIAQEKRKVLLDADTANEVDDAFALSIILMNPSIDVIALNATQWQASHWSTPNSMEDSHRLNQTLLGIMGLNVKTNRGGVARMFDWGDQAQHSAATYEIINQAKNLEGDEKLNVIALGALTNVASAIFIDPSISEKIRLFWLGSTYDFENEVLGRNDFNCMMDQFALSHLLFSKVEMHIIPVSVASKMTFEYDETRKKLENHFLGDFLLKIWDDHIDSGREKRTIWDLTIINAFLHPDWMEEVEVTTSKDNGSRKVYYYKDFDANKMREDFFAKIKAYKKP
ncbi:nucleoside hydrolase [Maribacter algarum]|uniref:Nucleoside hydrolase n=1 Tax=Maribacter algarum (ex Zhang et al. 2020) TaxID=2578118 RepID=A0A5S3PR94_9FLAO|nr:nucleoside hydrolase [Maribacter algarum]TMM57214.1 nucleoside hydrolase [Maribacter algarum]